jgi:dienelactone hydrolase
MVWDAIRAIDYLESRPEVDPNKICMTGTSGGGMMTTYILPFDDRISVAVPTCNPNTWSHRVHAGLSTDHEQVFFGAFESNIDPRGDPLFCQVPKPLLINATTDDNLNPPGGVWELSTWLFKSYSAHGIT